MKKLQASIREILLQEWDPIGVSDVAQAQDEYDSYLGEITRAVLAHQTVAMLANQLVTIETDRMGLAGDRTRALQVADRLLRLMPR